MRNDADQLFLIIEDTIPKDAEILITILFDGILNMTGKGFYLSKYFDDSTSLQGTSLFAI